MIGTNGFKRNDRLLSTVVNTLSLIFQNNLAWEKVQKSKLAWALVMWPSKTSEKWRSEKKAP